MSSQTGNFSDKEHSADNTKTAKASTKNKEMSERAFTKMLTTTSRNHYTLNQMVDRKSRILLSVNTLLFALIIGKLVSSRDISELKFLLFSGAAFASLISIVYAMLAIKPEKIKANLSSDKIKNTTGNPLYYGNFIKMSETAYQDAMMAMNENVDFVHKSLLQDIYHMGILLEQKRKYLRTALYILFIGVVITFILAIAFRITYEDVVATL